MVALASLHQFGMRFPAALALLPLGRNIGAYAAESKAVYVDWALNTTKVLNEDYLGPRGLWHDASSGTLWWNSANILTTLGNLAQVHPHFAANFTDIAKDAFAGGESVYSGFLDDYYDDEGWWALAWIKAYDVTDNSTYLDTAESIYTNLLTGLGGACGGMWWTKQKEQINTIENELFVAVSAALAIRVPAKQKYYVDYGKNRTDWLLSPNTGLLDADNVIGDGLNITTCTPGKVVFSYNQGVILGGLVDLANVTGNTTYLSIANDIAQGAIAKLATPNDGILTDPFYPAAENPTLAQFKGVFVRNLMYLQAADPDDAYVTFLEDNAESIWSSDQASNGTFGGLWQGPIKEVSASAQGSALDCFVAAANVTQ